jgi:hypothetical protein
VKIIIQGIVSVEACVEYIGLIISLNVAIGRLLTDACVATQKLLYSVTLIIVAG